ncbi:DUF368 domain-containing protein [Neptunomonas japonica]|uniref:DUF368 domain-containing protein n=1 Tax=Neptunomonas japonica JAMM 1380 TaxID=1441457 RepID=A0A7R6PFC7_9GAMM|nr:DUF368 domain-containing protein [Neptunomonas japonica]BBB28553.1 conserved hypothetical protein [Neptunomonas japonica JAMM 1380]
MGQSRRLKDYVVLTCKGILMGAADAVPGVSGGTIAFITGIYEELIGSIRRFDLEALKLLFSQGPQATWRHVNGSFLLALLLGIGLSLATLAHIVLFMLATYPVMLWSFFFGLILASTWVISRHVTHWDSSFSLLFLSGAAIAYLITSLTPTEIEVSMLTVFLSGSVAICAMILPGISGSFILLLLGMYSPILQAVKDLDLSIIGLFATGCAAGLLSFSRLLNWLFTAYKMQTLAVMSGFLLGSLNKVWPWKYTTAYTLNSHGKQVPLAQDNVSPFNYEALSGQDSFLMVSIILLVLGMVIVLWMERGQSTNR